MPKIINIAVVDKVATAQDAPVIVCGNSDYVIAFTFDDAWRYQDIKTARFVYQEAGERKKIDVPFVDDTVEVPPLFNTSSVEIGVFVGDLHTTTGATIPCLPSIRCGTGKPADPPPSSPYDKLVEEINNAATRADNAMESAVSAANTAQDAAETAQEAADGCADVLGQVEALAGLAAEIKATVGVE